MGWELVGRDEIQRWVDAVDDDDLVRHVLEWLQGFYDGYGFANARPTTRPDFFVARVPGTEVLVEFLVKHALDPPCVVIRRIAPPGPPVARA